MVRMMRVPLPTMLAIVRIAVGPRVQRVSARVALEGPPLSHTVLLDTAVGALRLSWFTRKRRECGRDITLQL